MVMKKQLGCIQVQVPPNIVDDENNDVSVNEGDNVTLTCKATGKPVPRIVWRRDDGQNLISNKHKWNTTNVISNSDNLQQNSVSSNEERVQGIFYSSNPFWLSSLLNLFSFYRNKSGRWKRRETATVSSNPPNDGRLFVYCIQRRSSNRQQTGRPQCQL